MHVIKPIGTISNNPSADDFNGATRVRILATAGNLTGYLRNSEAVLIGEFFMPINGYEMIISKSPTDQITCGTCTCHAIGI